MTANPPPGACDPDVGATPPGRIPTASIGGAMDTDERLLYEARVRMRQAIVAVAAGVLLVVAAVLQLAGPHTKVDELTLDLITAHKRFPLDLIGSVLNGIGLCAVAGTLSYLHEATHARNPEVRSFIRILVIIGGVTAAVVGVVYSAAIAVKANDFVSHGSQTYEQANHLTGTGPLAYLPFLGQLASLLLAIGFVLVALNAMRVGLLTRFMGYLGIFTGVLVLFPIGSPVPVVQGFWLVALGYLLSGRWPSGVPPSWRSGRIEKWPSSAEVREQRMKARGGTPPARGKAPVPQPAGATVGDGPRPGRAPPRLSASASVAASRFGHSSARTMASAPPCRFQSRGRPFISVRRAVALLTNTVTPPQSAPRSDDRSRRVRAGRTGG